MKEIYDPQAVIDVPTVEVARWGARFDRINFALHQNHAIAKGGGMSDDGQILYYLGEKALRGDVWENGPDYEDAIIYCLKPAVSYETVYPPEADAESAAVYAQNPLYAAAAMVQEATTEEGLTRAGVLTREEAARRQRKDLQIPIGAVAALCFQRADIRQQADRRLFDRFSEITDATTQILDEVQPRILTDHHKYRVPVYRALSYANPELQAKLGGGTHHELWWRELQTDLLKIDEASESL